MIPQIYPDIECLKLAHLVISLSVPEIGTRKMKRNNRVGFYIADFSFRAF